MAWERQDFPDSRLLTASQKRETPTFPYRPYGIIPDGKSGAERDKEMIKVRLGDDNVSLGPSVQSFHLWDRSMITSKRSVMQKAGMPAASMAEI